MNNKKFIIGVVILLLIMLGGTYAYYKWVSSENLDVKVKIEGGVVTFDGGSNIKGKLIPTASKEEGIKKDVTVTSNREGATINLYMGLTSMSSDLRDESFKYELYYDDNTLISSGNFGIYDKDNNSSGINYEEDNTTLTFFMGRSISVDKVDKYTLYLWFNGKDYDNPNKMQNNDISFDLYATGENAVLNDNNK